MSSIYDEAPTCTVLRQTRRIAKKRHICTVCNRAILPGAEYLSEAVVIDGVFESASRHAVQCWHWESARALPRPEEART